MTIQENGGSDNSQRGSNRAEEQAEPRAQQQTRPEASFAWNFHQSNPTGNPIAAGVGGEYLTKFRASLNEVLKEIAVGVSISVLSLSRQTFTNQRFSALVVAARVPEFSETTVAYYTLILEATGAKLDPVTRNIDGKQLQLNRVTGDAYDAVLNENAFRAVQEEFPEANVISANAMVVPATVTVDKKEVIENIARNAAMACYSIVSQATGNFNAMNLANMDRDVRLSIDVAFGNHQDEDIVGNPIRSSVLINYTSMKNRPNQSQQGLDIVNVADSSTRICELSGFLNPIWAPVDQSAGFGFNNYRQQGQPRPTQKFIAEFVITNIRTDYATSPAAVLLALSSFLALVDNNTWIQGFVPRASRRESGKTDITDIGALNITGNLGGDPSGFGAPCDMKPLESDMQELSEYLTSLFQQGCVVSVDCAEARAQSWYMSYFADAAAGDVEAQNLIIDAANELTNGRFSEHFPVNASLFTNIVRVPLGTYPAGDHLCDIRNIDFTAISNIFAGQPAMIHEYSWTFEDRPGMGAISNLCQRENLIKAALDQQCTIDGYGARVTFSGDFITAFSAAIADCNVNQVVNTPLNQDMLRAATPSPSYIAGSLAGATRTFSSGYQAPGRQQAYRFGRNRFN